MLSTATYFFLISVIAGILGLMAIYWSSKKPNSTIAFLVCVTLCTISFLSLCVPIWSFLHNDMKTSMKEFEFEQNELRTQWVNEARSLTAYVCGQSIDGAEAWWPPYTQDQALKHILNHRDIFAPAIASIDVYIFKNTDRQKLSTEQWYYINSWWHKTGKVKLSAPFCMQLRD